MPLYAARWPDFTLSIVEADNQRQMLSYLDEIAEPNAVNFKRLEKPFFLSLKVDQQEKDVAIEKFDLGMSLMDDGEFYDVSFVVDNTEVKCHKAILASRSSYFRELFKESTCDNKISVKDTSLSVFLVVKEYIYTNNVDWHTPIECKFLLDVFKYTKTIGGLTELTESVRKMIKNKKYYMKPKDLVHGYRVTEHLDEVLNAELKEKLHKDIREEKKENEAKTSNIIKNLDSRLHEKLLSDINKEIMLEDKIKNFSEILVNFKGKNFVSKVSQFIDETFNDEDFNMSYNPYFALVYRCVSDCTPHFKKQCIRLINVLSKYNFEVDKKQKMFAYGVCEGTPLCLAALNGMLDLVKALVNVGADVLQKIHPNGETLLHVIDEKITESKSELGGVIAILNREGQLSNICDVKLVFDWLMSCKGYNNISQVPFQEATKKKTIGKEYVEKLMCGFVSSEASVPFQIEKEQCETNADCHKELAEMLHPRVSEIASGIDELNYPDDVEELKKRVADAAKTDWEEASRVFHPNPQCRKMTDDTGDSDDEMDDMDMEMDTDIISMLLRNINSAQRQ